MYVPVYVADVICQSAASRKASYACVRSASGVALDVHFGGGGVADDRCEGLYTGEVMHEARCSYEDRYSDGH